MKHVVCAAVEMSHNTTQIKMQQGIVLVSI